MERDLGEARLLFCGTASAAWGLGAIVVWFITVGVAIGQGDPVPAALDTDW